MIINLQKYWQSVRRTEANLPEGQPFVYIVSVEHEEHGINSRAGRIVEVSRQKAAEALVNRTHRLAEEHEIEAFQSAQRETAEEIARKEFEKRQPIAITVQDGTARVSKGKLAA